MNRSSYNAALHAHLGRSLKDKGNTREALDQLTTWFDLTPERVEALALDAGISLAAQVEVAPTVQPAKLALLIKNYNRR